jgi:DNA-binding NarL/FixJ family response regulator
MSVRVVLVDDQALIRTSFKMILEAEDDIEVVGEATDGEATVGEATVATTRQLRPDVVLMDVQMPTMNGLCATGQTVADTNIPSRIIIRTTFDRDDCIFDALRVGASRFLLKNSPSQDLVHAVRVVAAGAALLAPPVTRKVIEEFTARPVDRAAIKRNSDVEPIEKPKSSNC